MITIMTNTADTIWLISIHMTQLTVAITNLRARIIVNMPVLTALNVQAVVLDLHSKRPHLAYFSN